MLAFVAGAAADIFPSDLAEAIEGVLRARYAGDVMDEAYRSDKANFTGSPYLSTEFVGLGPYRMVRWEQGSFLEAVRFDDY